MAKNVLKHNELIKLAAWITNKKDQLGLLTYQQIAKIAQSELKFEITDMNVKGAIKAMPELGIKIQRPKPVQKIDKLRDAVCLLFERCGEQVPEDIGHLW